MSKVVDMDKDEIIQALWDILDDIDTASDMAKGDNEWYRKRIEYLQVKRWETGITIENEQLKMPR